jgi:hypothetical protein
MPVIVTKADQANLNLILTLEIFSSNNQKFYQQFATLENHSATFAFKIPESTPIGEYTLRVLSSVVPETIKMVKVVSSEVLGAKVSTDKTFTISDPQSMVTSTLSQV